MTVTTLDAKTALLVIDLQQGVVSLPSVHPINGVVQQASALAAAFRQHGLPVVLVNVAGGAPGWTELIPALNRQPQDHAITKRTPGAFTNTGLDAHLKARGVTQVVVVGVATSNGVEATARQAYELGYHVTFATDAMTDLDAEVHHNSVTRIFPRIGETGTAGEIIGLLEREA